MADRIEAFHVTMAANTPSSAPVRTNTTFLDGIVTEIEVVVPPGPSGLAGFRFDYNDVRQIPLTTGAFIITDDEIIRWPVHAFPTGGKWSVLWFNTDVNPHTIEVRYLIDELPLGRPRAVILPAITQPNQPAPAVEG